MSAITTHVLDTASGRPAADLPVTLERFDPETARWEQAGAGLTDADGRLRDLPAATREAGTYRLTFDTGAYFTAQGIIAFYPEVSVTFTVANTAEHYHVPLLLSPFGYSTYRGS